MLLIAAVVGAVMYASVAVAGAGHSARSPLTGVDLRDAGHCEFIAAGDCLFPWPDDYYTVRDRHTATGRRLNLRRAAMPRNSSGAPVDPGPYDRNDGFSPGQEIVLKVPGLDTPAAFARTGAVPITDMRQTYRRNQPIVVIDARTRRRQLIWSELDANASTAGQTALLIHPGADFQEGHRYIVALRELRDADGHVLPAPPGFALYRNRVKTHVRVVERRRAHFESIFHTLGRAHIGRRDLYLAWDFTVASQRSLSGPMLHIRNDAFRQLGDRNLADLKVAGRAPRYRIDSVTDFTPAQNALIARKVTGTLDVPCYLNRRGCPTGSSFHYARGSDLPSQMRGNVYRARFVCNIPRSSGIAGGRVHPGRPSLYGHGLLGDPFSEIDAGNVQAMSAEHDFVFCATPEIGFAKEDVPTAIAVLGNLAKFPEVGDRTQQGLLDELYLGRLMIHPHGLAANRAFRGAGGVSAIDRHRLFYDGNSQGGILGGALTAIAPDFTRAVLGVPGMNYSVLLPRSSDFKTYSLIFYPAYPNQLQRPLVLSIVQLLWDRAEAQGYAQHMTDHPLPDTPRHTVLMHEALGDFQVADVMAETEARTIGARVRSPIVDRGRSLDRIPFYGIHRLDRFPYFGSVIELWDSGPIRDGGQLGVDPPPPLDVAPSQGNDPHEAPRNSAAARQQKSEFLQIHGRVIDVCGARPCYDAGWTGSLGR